MSNRYNIYIAVHPQELIESFAGTDLSHYVLCALKSSSIPSKLYFSHILAICQLVEEGDLQMTGLTEASAFRDCSH